MAIAKGVTTGLAAQPATRGLEATGSEVSIRRLQAVWAVAHTGSMTRAAKLLGVSQPSLSQQLSTFEAAIGGQLFNRRANQMELTELGTTLLARAEQVLRSVQEIEDILPCSTTAGQRHSIRISGAGSMLRNLLPEAMRRIDLPLETLEFDVQEGAPAEVLEALYARRANIGLVAAGSLPEGASGFHQTEIACDPHVLVVPEQIDLAACADLSALAPADHGVLNNALHFVFGSHRSSQIQDWYDLVFPASRALARLRSFDAMIEMARAGLGVCIVPALSLANSQDGCRGLRLYHTGLAPRRIVALFPPQYRNAPPYRAMIAALGAAGGALELPPIAPQPPFVARAMQGWARSDQTAEDRQSLSPL